MAPAVLACWSVTALATADWTAVPTNNSIGTVKPLAILPDASSITHSRVKSPRASTVTREPKNGRVCPTPWAKWSRGVVRLRGAFVAVVQAADLGNGEHASCSQRRDPTLKGCILVQPEVRSRSRVVGDVLVQNAPKAGS